MLGKVADCVPCGRTVSNMNYERLLISQNQMSELSTKSNLTLATDETPKQGDVYMTYTVTDAEGGNFVLGLREMVSKSSEDTLTIFQKILDDITDVCDGSDDDVGTRIHVLCQIKNTMSDRAATESKFNNLLQSYRESCLPKIDWNWQSLNKAAKQKLIAMNNFFYGLHLLVSMAETISSSFKQFENL